jgi:hypothetical protein
MNTEVWFNDPMVLFRTSQIAQFWPTATQTPEERINATTRFILYAACLTYLIKRDVRIFILAAMVIVVVFVMFRSGMVKRTEPRPTEYFDQKYAQTCQLPTVDNPMGNVLISDYTDNPNRPPACDYTSVQPMVKSLLDDTIQYDCGRSRCAMPDVQRRAAGRQWVTMAPSTIPGDQTGFAEWCYGKKFAPLCRNDPSKCDPNVRGVQLDVFAGLDSSGAPRTGVR